MQIARQLNMSEVIVPANSSVFSAMGLLSTDFVMRLSRTVGLDLSGESYDEVNALAAELSANAREMMRGEGFVEVVEDHRGLDHR